MTESPSAGPVLAAAGAQPARIAPSATIVLVRDGRRELEVLMVQRSRSLSHMGGMWVFPGGKVDAADQQPGDDADATALRAAIRETREETGLSVAAEQLLYFSHWTTPEGVKRRYATWFFLGLLDAGQQVEVDGSEIADYRWVAPQRALREHADPDHALRLFPPTYVTLQTLAPYASCAAARAALRAQPADQFLPRMVSVEGGVCFLYEQDAGYDSLDPGATGPQHRTLMIGDSLRYIRES